MWVYMCVAAGLLYYNPQQFAIHGEIPAAIHGAYGSI
jgi:hypothetical protein